MIKTVYVNFSSNTIQAILTLGFPPGGVGFPVHLDRNSLCKLNDVIDYLISLLNSIKGPVEMNDGMWLRFAYAKC